MKNLIIASLLLLTACSHPDDKRIKAIEADIKKNALGIDIGYKAGTLDTVVVVRTQESIKDLSEQIGHDLSTQMDKAIEIYTGVYEDAKTNNDVTTYHVWKNIVERMKRLKTAKPDQIDYSIYKYNYSVTNGLNPKERADVVSYYFFDYRDSLVGECSDDVLKKAKIEFIKSPLQPYDMVLTSLQTGIDL